MVEHMTRMHKALSLISSTAKIKGSGSVMVAQLCTSSPWQVEAEESGGQDQSLLYGKTETSLNYVRLSQKPKLIIITMGWKDGSVVKNACCSSNSS